jgi:hypothetical protein
VTLPIDLLRSEFLLLGPDVPEEHLVAIVDDVFLPLVGQPHGELSCYGTGDALST